MKTKNLSKRKKVLSFFTLFLLIFSVFSASYSDASDKDDKIYIIVTGFTHIWGHAQNPATDTLSEVMPFTAANYNIVNRGQIYDYDGKKVTVGFGNSFKDGNKGLDLSYIDDVFPIKDAKAYLYDPSLPQIESSRWTTALDPQNGKNVGFNETVRAQEKLDYDFEYFARNTNPSAVTSSYNQSTKKISFYSSNSVPSFSSLGSDINAFNQRVVRLDHLARRSYAEVDDLMVEFSGPEWETYYPDVRARLMEAASNTEASRTLRGYMFFTSYIVEIELERNAELAMADTIFQNERTSFTDGSGTLRDKLEVYDMDGVQIMGDTLNPGQRYRMCSYILNAGTTDTTREVLPEFYMVKNDVRNFTIPNHMKENLGTSQANLN